MTTEYYLELMVRRKNIDPAGVVKESKIIVEKTCGITRDQLLVIADAMKEAGLSDA